MTAANARNDTAVTPRNNCTTCIPLNGGRSAEENAPHSLNVKETASTVARASPLEAPRKPNRTAPHSKHGYSANFTGRPGTTPKTTATTNAVVTRNRPASIIRQSEGQTGGTSQPSLNASTSGAKTMMPTTSAIQHASHASAKGV